MVRKGMGFPIRIPLRFLSTSAANKLKNRGKTNFLNLPNNLQLDSLGFPPPLLSTTSLAVAPSSHRYTTIHNLPMRNPMRKPLPTLKELLPLRWPFCSFLDPAKEGEKRER